MSGMRVSPRSPFRASEFQRPKTGAEIVQEEMMSRDIGDLLGLGLGQGGSCTRPIPFPEDPETPKRCLLLLSGQLHFVCFTGGNLGGKFTLENMF